jgi:hypothetical protein
MSDGVASLAPIYGGKGLRERGIDASRFAVEDTVSGMLLY